MELHDKERIKQVRQLSTWFNFIPNLLWSVLSLTPISIYCYQFVDLKILGVFFGASLLTILLPERFFDHLQLSKSPFIYKRIRVNLINKFTQNGTIINNRLRKRFPEYKIISIRKRSVNNLIRQTYMFEKFHFLMFTFFTPISIYAAITGSWGWVLIITFSNIIYNIYPTLLQQYIRVKLNQVR